MASGGLLAVTVEPTSGAVSPMAFICKARRVMGLGVIALTILTSCQPQSPQVSAPPVLADQPTAIDLPLSAPPPPPPGAYLGKVSPPVFDQLKDLPLLAPAYIPPGFTLAEHGTTPSNGYYLIYRSPADQCFAIEHQSAGQTPETLPPDITSLPVESFNSPLFGPTRNLYHSKEEPAPAKLVSQWLTNPQGAYRLSGADTVQTYPAQTACRNVPLAEAVKIINSMTDLTAAPTESVGGDY